MAEFNPLISTPLPVGIDPEEHETAPLPDALTPQPTAKTRKATEVVDLQKRRDETVHSAVAADMAGATEVNPDQFASLRKMATEVNLDTRILLGDVEPENIRSQHVVKQTQEMLKENPRIENFLRDPENTRLVHDDLRALRYVYQSIRELQESEQHEGVLDAAKGTFDATIGGFGRSVEGTNLAILEQQPRGLLFAEAVNELTEDERIAFGKLPAEEQIGFLLNTNEKFKAGHEKTQTAIKTSQEDLTAIERELNQIRARVGTSTTAFYANAIGEAVGGMIPAIAVGLVTRNPMLAQTIMFGQAFGNRYAQATLRDGFDSNPNARANEALTFAALEFFSEKVPLGILLSENGRGMKGIFKSMGAEAVQETFIEYMDIGFELGYLDKEMTVGDALERLRDAAIIGAGAGGTLRGGIQGMRRLAEIGGMRREEDDAEDHAAKLTAAQQAVKEAKLSARSEVKMREFIEEAGEGTTVSISAEDVVELQQSGVLTDADMADLELTEALAEALVLNGDIEISTAKMLTLQEATQTELIRRVRQDSSKMSVKEAEDQLAERDELIKRLVEEAQTRLQDDPDHTPISDAVAEQLRSIGIFSEEEVQQTAQLAEESYGPRAANLEGVSAFELFLEENVQLRGPADTQRNAATVALNQTSLALGVNPEDLRQQLARSGGEIRKTEAFLNWFGDGVLVDADGLAVPWVHGTASDIRAFEAFATSNVTAFFSRDPIFAEGFADEWAEAKSRDNAGDDAVLRRPFQFDDGVRANLVPVFLNVKNPFDPENEAHVQTLIDYIAGEQGLEPLGEASLHHLRSGDFVQLAAVSYEIEAAGFDSYFEQENGQRNIAVFEPTAIKSPFNQGTFDPNVADILKQSAQSLTDTENFRVWFGDSVVVDEDGQPLVVYHGSPEVFDTFDPDAVPDRGGLVAFVTSDRTFAEGYASDGRGNVLELYASIQNPFDFRTDWAMAQSFWEETGGIFDQFEIDRIAQGLGTFVEGQPATLTEEEFVGAVKEGSWDALEAPEFAQWLNEGGHDGVVLMENEAINYGVFEAEQLKSVNNQGEFSDAAGTSIFEQSDVLVGTQADRVDAAIAAKPKGMADGTKHGVLPHLRSLAEEDPSTSKASLMLKTTNANAQRQLDAIDSILENHPDAHTSPEAWAAMMAEAYGSRDVPMSPYRFINDITGQGAIDGLSRLSPGQIEDADHGFENAAEFREAYTSGALGVDTTGKLFLWSFLSRGVSPYTQESLFIDAFDGIDPWLQAAADGNFDVDAYAEWAKSAAPKGSGQPGAGATHNLNAFGKDFLVKMAQDSGDGRSRLQLLHDLMADPKATGKQVRRAFATFGEGVGIDNKVVSFTLLVAGFSDVMVLDRVQFRQLYDDGRFAGINLYDGMKKEGKPVTGTSFAKQGDGVRGIFIYEAMERAIEARIDEIYTALGREGEGSVGRYHWETWVADSEQEASHGSLGAILPDALGNENAINEVTAKQGEYGSYAYGARYGVDGSGNGFFLYNSVSAKTYIFTVEQFVDFQTEVKKPANGVVPTGFKVTESGNAPWHQRDDVSGDALEALAAKIAEGPAGTQQGTVRKDGKNETLPDRPATDQPGSPLEQDPNARRQGVGGSFRQEQDAYGNIANVISFTKDADRTTFLHELGHFWLFQMHKDMADPRLTEAGRVRLEQMMGSTKSWFKKNSKDAWRDIQKIADAAEAEAVKKPDNGSFRLKADRLKAAVAHAKKNGGAKYMETVADGFMDGSVEQGTDLEVGFHELWARGVESWLGEGRAPSSGMRRAFTSFSTWVIGTYKRLRNLNVELDAEIRDVFDRLVATDEEIAYERDRALYTIPQEIRDAATPAELAQIEAAEIEAIHEARAQMQGKVAAELKRERTVEYKTSKERLTSTTLEDIQSRPLYKALNILRTGGDVNTEAVFLDRAEFIALYGQEKAKAMPPRVFGGKDSDRINLPLLAQLSGFEGQDQMVEALTTPHPSEAALLEAEVNAALREQFGSLLDPDKLADEAQEVVQNDKMVELMAIQARLVRRLAKEPLQNAAQRRALDEGAPLDAKVDREAVEDEQAVAGLAESQEDAIPGELRVAQTQAQKEANKTQRVAQRAAVRRLKDLTRSLDLKGIKAAAKEIVARMKVGKITPQKFRQTADRLAKKAHLAIAGRDYAAAADLLEQRTLNLEIAREAQEKRTKIDRRVKAVRKILGRIDTELKGYNIDVLTAVRLMLEPYGLASENPSNLPAKDVIALLAEVEPEMATGMEKVIRDVAVAAAPYIEATGNDRPYREMPLELFETLMDTAQSYIALARDMKTVLIDGRRVQFDTVADELAQSTADLDRSHLPALGKGTERERNAIGWRGTIRTYGRRVEAWARSIDGGDDGPIQKYFTRPVMKAVDAYYAAKLPLMNRVLEIIEPQNDELAAPTAIKADELGGYTFRTKGELLHWMLHTGNESNIRKLLIGGAVDVGNNVVYQWTEMNDPRDEVNTDKADAFIRRMFSTGVLTAQDVQTLNSIWALFEETKGGAQQAHHQMHGHYFDTVGATPRQTPFGELTGGYVPALTDPLMNPDGLRQEQADQLGNAQHAAMFPGAEDGFTKGRVDYNQPLALDLRMLPLHLDKVLKFTHLGPPIRSAAQLLVNRRFAATLNRVDRYAINGILEPWLRRTARQSLSEPGNRHLDSFFRALSQRIGVQTMAGNIVNTAQQFTGVITAFSRLPMGVVLKNFGRFQKDGQGTLKYIEGRSNYMTNRFRNSVNDVAENINAVLTDATPLGKLQYYANKFGYITQQLAQNAIDPAVWLGAEEHAHNNGLWQQVYDAHLPLGRDIAYEKAQAASALYADEIVRATQTPLGPQDVSRGEASGAFTRLFFKFAGYFNNMANLSLTEAQVIMRDIGFKGNKPGRLLWLYLSVIAVPSIVAEGISMAASGDFDDMDENEAEENIRIWLNLFAVSQVKMVSNFVPGVGGAVSWAVGQTTEQFYDDRLSLSPVLSIGEASLSAGAGVAEDAYNSLTDSDGRPLARTLKDTLTFAGLLLGLPTNWFSKPASYALKVKEGQADPEGVLDWVQGYLRGRDGTED
jgi:hypothetical protein